MKNRSCLVLGLSGLSIVLFFAGCILSPAEEQEWWYYCNSSGCYQCDRFGCDLTRSICPEEGTCSISPTCNTENEHCGKSTCDLTEDCGEGYICSSGHCVPKRGPCDGHASCGSGAYCKNGECINSDQCSGDTDCAYLGDFKCDIPSGNCVPAPPAQQTCENADDCTGDFCVNEQCGSCPGDCGGGLTCQSNKHCGSGRVCLNGQCTNQCKVKDDCGSGQICKTGICIKDSAQICSKNSECTSGEQCVNGQCFPDCTVSGSCLSAADFCSSAIDVQGDKVRICLADHHAQPECKTNKECNGEVCVNGVCRTSCVKSEDCEGCEDGKVCGLGGFCMTEEESKPACQTKEGCTSGEQCLNAQCVSM